MPVTKNFDETAAAYEKVVSAIAQLRHEYDSVCTEIVTTEEALQAAQVAYLPLSDLKAGILDFIDASGSRYAEERIRTAISDFARNRLSSSRSDVALSDKPMRFCDLERCVSGQDGAGGWAQLLTPEKNMFNDQVLYYFASKQVKEGLAKLMDAMPEEAFGYGQLSQEEIGSDRTTRRKNIASMTAKLSGLREQCEVLKAKLEALGVKVPVQSGSKR